MNPKHDEVAVERGWPDGVTRLTIKNLNYLGIDRQQNLYWDGRPVEVRRTLTRWQTFWAVIVGACIVAGTFATGVQAYVAWMQYANTSAALTEAAPGSPPGTLPVK